LAGGIYQPKGNEKETDVSGKGMDFRGYTARGPMEQRGTGQGKKMIENASGVWKTAQRWQEE